MRDPKQTATFAFRCYEKESADLKIRLRYDNLKQATFFRTVMKLYLDNDPDMLKVLEKIKSGTRAMGASKIKKTSMDIKEGEKMLEQLGITKKSKLRLMIGRSESVKKPTWSIRWRWLFGTRQKPICEI